MKQGIKNSILIIVGIMIGILLCAGVIFIGIKFLPQNIQKPIVTLEKAMNIAPVIKPLASDETDPSIERASEEAKNYPYQILSLQAFEYYSADGAISENIIDNKKYSLFNVVSDETLVVVEVQGKRGDYIPDRSVELTAIEKGKIIEEAKQEIGMMGERNGKFFAAFMVHNTGASELTLQAKIIGQDDSQEIEKKIGFYMGE